MKKKVISVLLASAMVMSMFAGCGKKADDTAADTAQEENTGGAAEDSAAEDAADETADTEGTDAGEAEEGTGKTFTVGFDAEYPPYGFMDENGEYTGFDLELAEAVCDLEGWELVKKPINWDSKDMELNSGSIDCIWNVFPAYPVASPF